VAWAVTELPRWESPLTSLVIVSEPGALSVSTYGTMQRRAASTRSNPDHIGYRMEAY
jgi:hypothetical protein